MLALGNQTLVNRAGEQGDAVPADLIEEVLSGLTSPGVAGKTQKYSYFFSLFTDFS